MRDRAVVALEEVLDADLPVARVVVRLRPTVEPQRIDVDTAFREVRGQVAERVRKRRRPRVRVDEHERAEHLHRDRDEAERVAVEPRLAVHPRGVSQRAVQAVRPGVVRALDRLAPRVPVAEEVAAVTADVDEPAKLPVPGAGQDERERPGPGGRQAAGLGDLVEARRVLPGAREDVSLLESEHRRVRVPVVRKGARHGGDLHGANLAASPLGPGSRRAWTCV